MWADGIPVKYEGQGEEDGVGDEGFEDERRAEQQPHEAAQVSG